MLNVEMLSTGDEVLHGQSAFFYVHDILYSQVFCVLFDNVGVGADIYYTIGIVIPYTIFVAQFSNGLDNTFGHDSLTQSHFV